MRYNYQIPVIKMIKGYIDIDPETELNYDQKLKVVESIIKEKKLQVATFGDIEGALEYGFADAWRSRHEK